jgi:glycerol-3-phosphate dehydrogenase (NAD(P)+)
MNVASRDTKSIKVVKAVMENNHLRLIKTRDLVCVEVAGSFKNVYAIAMGLCDGLKMAMNTKSALLVLALKEIGKLVKKMGGKSETVYDLAGLGDLIGTGLCAESRNRRFGEYLAQGHEKDEAIKMVGQVVEGVNASKVLKELGEKYKLKMPFAEMVYGVVWNGVDPLQALTKFLRSIK